MIYKVFEEIYKTINRKVVHNVRENRVPVSEQKKFLEKFSEPKDDYERSYFKYQCFLKYCYYQKYYMCFIYNVGAMVLYPFVYIILRHRGKFKEKTKFVTDAVIQNGLRVPNKDVLPDEIRKKYPNSVEIRKISYDNVFLDPKAIEICKELSNRYFFSFYYRLIVMLKLAQFVQYIYDNNPKAIVYYSCEREFSGPLQTLLCEKQGVVFESFMHGDYVYELCFAFQRYSHYYTWDKTYNEMFKALRCKFPTTVYVPAKLKGIADAIDDHECEYFITYYFSAESKASAEEIHNVFQLFKEQGLRCKVRPHPRFSNIKMLEQLFHDFVVEKPADYSLANSISDSMYIAGLLTTVLSQAFFSGKKIVVDDVSWREKYSELIEKEYISLKRPHKLLSDLVEEVKDKNFKGYKFKF